MPIVPLHPVLAKDGLWVTELSACCVLLINDSRYPWLVLVPDRANLTDLDQLNEGDMALVMQDIRLGSRVLRRLFEPTKLNVAALGNMVPQLHIHLIARFSHDAAWPKPVWGAHPAIPYDKASRAQRVMQLQQAFVAEQGA
ncbi:histidine triad (HIT) protein [Magnetococcus marinus MC-1]|uniref:Histidine triad (HIT) protein n=1 Tax=Magnetococcus marinus (strain ATCC BAA-1437 / JCM 17883 / MC-1) TaxID=156889 RepID=A0LAE8_MAGMM|nr:HIT family protein [Magnetococcus marinus]ABK44941.1 histidine triad (HIT) protein [Magnetococcus marinus MC-1]